MKKIMSLLALTMFLVPVAGSSAFAWDGDRHHGARPEMHHRPVHRVVHQERHRDHDDWRWIVGAFLPRPVYPERVVYVYPQQPVVVQRVVTAPTSYVYYGW